MFFTIAKLALSLITIGLVITWVVLEYKVYKLKKEEKEEND